MRNKKYWALILFFFIISFFTRATQVFNSYNYYFDSEKAKDYIATKNIVIDHEIVLTAHQGGLNTFSKPPGFNYLLSIPFVIGNGDPFAGRLMMLSLSILTVIITFILTNKIFKLRTALFVTLLLIFSPIMKDYAASISPPFLIPLPMVIFIYLLFEIFKGKKNLIPILVFVVGIMANLEMATSVSLLFLLIGTAVILIPRKIIPARYYFISLGLFLLNLLSIIIYDVQNNFLNLKGAYKVIEAMIIHSTEYIDFDFFELLGSRTSVFKWNFSATFSGNFLIWLTILVLIIFGIIKIIRDKKTKPSEMKFISYLAIIPFFTFAFLLFYPGIVIPQWWIIHLSVIYCFLLGIVLDYFWKVNNLKFISVIIIFILGILSFNRTIFLYKTQFTYPPSMYIKETIPINYAFADAKNKPFGIYILSEGSQEKYDYLIWWIGRTKYSNYQPYREKKGLYYLIIEPHIYTDVAKKLINKFKTDKLVKTEIMSNGFIVEKRLVE